ncbi:MAG: hypothetical protein R2752_23185 [Vicinamibacterales bacterium]
MPGAPRGGILAVPMLATAHGVPFPTAGVEPPLTAARIVASVAAGWRPTTCPICRRQPAAFYGEAIGLIAYFICPTCQRFSVTPLGLDLLDQLDDASRRRLSAHAAASTAPPCYDETNVRTVGHPS